MKTLFTIGAIATILSAQVATLSQADQHEAPTNDPQSMTIGAQDGRLNGLRWNGLRWNGLRWNGLRWNGLKDTRPTTTAPVHSQRSKTTPFNGLADRPLGQ